MASSSRRSALAYNEERGYLWLSSTSGRGFVLGWAASRLPNWCTPNTAHTGTLNPATERFEARLTAACSELKADLREDIVNGDTAIRVALVEGLASIRDETSRLRGDVLRWSLLFWLGQFAALASMFSILVRALGR